MVVTTCSGSYLFWIASDDASELWLSTDDDPANKRLVCNCSSDVWYREFTEQRSEQIELVAGQAYYFEVSVDVCLAYHSSIDGCLSYVLFHFFRV